MAAPKPVIDIEERRLLLFSTRLRFDPKAQPVREAAIDRVLEQNLLLADQPLSITDIEKQCVDFHGQPAFTRFDLESSIRRLQPVLTVVDQDRVSRYALSDKRKQEMWAAEKNADNRYRTIINRLFTGAEGGAGAYDPPFKYCLSLVFSRLGEAYVRHMRGEISTSDLLAIPSVVRAIGDTKKRFPKIDQDIFGNAIFRFFDEGDPESTTLKWALGQNYYTAKALGFDPSGQLLSLDVFKDGIFYLDTNLIVHGLDPTGRHHHSFRALIESCKRLGIQLNVAQISIDELRRVAAMERDLLKSKVAELTIPAETLPKVRGILLPAYLEEQRIKGSCDLDKLFEKFDAPSEYLRNEYGVDVIDATWFDETAQEVDFQKFVAEVRGAYRRPDGKQKSLRAANHDGLLLRWVERERATQNKKTWLVTLDMSLPGFKDGDQTNLAKTLIALMPWIAPVGIGDTDNGDAAAIFSEALAQHLLPHEAFFELRDFLIFSKMEIETAALPAKDVEECIRSIKVHLPGLDPTNPGDREKLSHEVSKFFADVGREYKTTLAEKAREIDERDKRLDALARSHESAVQQFEKNLAEKDAKIRELQDLQSRRSKRTAAMLWTGGLVLVDIAVIVATTYLVITKGAGDNLVQKFINGSKALEITIAALLLGNALVLGRDRLSALKSWRLGRLFGRDD